MGESTSQIERDIAAERNELGRNLQLLENKARSLTDWRMHFRKHPFALMAVALGGGALLGVLSTRLNEIQATEPEYDEERFVLGVHGLEKLGDGLARGGNLGAHTSAGIHKQAHRKRRVFARELLHFLLLAVL